MFYFTSRRYRNARRDHEGHADELEVEETEVSARTSELKRASEEEDVPFESWEGDAS